MRRPSFIRKNYSDGIGASQNSSGNCSIHLLILYLGTLRQCSNLALKNNNKKKLITVRNAGLSVSSYVGIWAVNWGCL